MISFFFFAASVTFRKKGPRLISAQVGLLSGRTFYNDDDDDDDDDDEAYEYTIRVGLISE